MEKASCTKCPKIIVIHCIWFGFDAAYSFVITEKQCRQGFKCFAVNVFQLHEDS